MRGLSIAAVKRWIADKVFPRVRGFSDGVERQFNIIWLYSPRIRGLSDARTGNEVIFLVFPPCAGVIGSLFVSTSSAERIPPSMRGYRLLLVMHFFVFCIPPVCGGYRNGDRQCTGLEEYYPRLRGLSGSEDDMHRHRCVFPPLAGGYRVPCTKTLVVAKYSPRMRGLSVTFKINVYIGSVFPPHAGVST